MALAHRKLPVLTQQQNERFHSHVDRRGPDECWPWKGAKRYPRVTIGGIVFNANRIAYSMENGKDPGAMFVCHTCDNPPCCNPAHFFLGTCVDNRRDCREKGRMNIATGERAGGALLTANAVQLIRASYETGDFTQQQLADQFGVKRETVSRVLLGKIWRHLDADRQQAISIGDANKSRATSERNHRDAKLTDDDVREIKRLKASGKMMQKEIARQFGVTPSHISIIVNGKFKANVTPYGSKA